MIDLDEIEALASKRGVDRKALVTGLLDALYGGDIPANARLLYARLLTRSFAQKTPGEIAISISTASAAFGIPKSTYCQVLKKLRNAGWIDAERRTSEGNKDMPSIMKLTGSAGETGGE